MINTKVTENVIIIGGGPAGLAAGIYNARANLSPLLFAGSPPGGQLTLTSEVENYPGYEKILGPDLIENMRKQAKGLGVRVIDENILSIHIDKKPFSVKTMSQEYFTKTILITTGAKALWLGLDSETRLRGKGVSACATCDGFFFKNKVVAVVGGGDTAMEEASTLTKFASKVILIHRRDAFRASKIMQDRVLNNPKVTVFYNTAITEIVGENKVTGVKIVQDGKNKDIILDGVFMAIGHKPDTDLFSGKIQLDKKEYIITSSVKEHEIVQALKAGKTSSIEGFDFTYPTMTSVPGVFAGGDCVDHRYRQAATAAGMGVAAALDVERYLAR